MAHTEVSEHNEHLNADELVPPDFLNEDYVRNMLVGDERSDDVKVLKLKIVPGSKKGDHFASIIFRICVSYSVRGRVIEDRSLIMKAMPMSEGAKKDMLSQIPLFDNEITMYATTLREMEQILQHCGEKPWWPKMVYYSHDPAVIVFDDLGKDNYEMIYKPFNFDELQLVIEKLAKFHALSLVLEEQGHATAKYVNPFESPQVKKVFANFTNALPSFAAEVQKWPGFEKIGAALSTLHGRVMDKFNSSYEPRDWGYNVVCHNDFHIRNMLFKRGPDGGAPINMMFLDFQCPFYGSPAMDISAMLCNMGDQSARDRRLEVYRNYYDWFAKALEIYGYTGAVPSLIDLHTEILKQGGAEVFHTLFLLPLHCADMTKLDSEMMMADDGRGMVGFLEAVYKQPELVEIMKKLLPRLYYKGWLE